jgi:hypothetical protein
VLATEIERPNKIPAPQSQPKLCAAHHGGFDDVVFLKGKIYFSASHPAPDASGNNPAPSIVSIKLVRNTIQTTPVLYGDAYAFNVTTKLPVKPVQTDRIQ